MNSQAAAALQAAGFTAASCAPEVESFPGGSWTINACKVPSMPAATFSADTVITQTPAQLAAIYQQDLPQMGQSNQSLNQQIAALTGNKQAEALAAAPIGSAASTAIQYAGVSQPAAAAVPAASTSSSAGGGYSIADLVAAFQSANSGAAAGASSSSSASSLLSGTVSILGVSIPVWALGLGAVGLGAVGLFLFLPRR